MHRIFMGETLCGTRTVRYYLLAEESSDGRACYGVQVADGQDWASIPAITPSQVAVLDLAARLIRGLVTPTTARDVVEDWLLT